MCRLSRLGYRYLVPNLVLHHKHTELFKLLAQFLNVKSDKAVFYIHIGSVVEYAQTAFYVDFKCVTDMLCSYGVTICCDGLYQ